MFILYYFKENFLLPKSDYIVPNISNFIFKILLIFFLQEELFVATKRFVVLRDLKITASKSDPFKPYEDNAIVVHYVPLTSNKRCNELRSMSEK